MQFIYIHLHILYYRSVTVRQPNRRKDISQNNLLIKFTHNKIKPRLKLFKNIFNEFVSCLDFYIICKKKS